MSERHLDSKTAAKRAIGSARGLGTYGIRRNFKDGKLLKRMWLIKNVQKDHVLQNMWDDIYLVIHNGSGWGLAHQDSGTIHYTFRVMRLDYLKCWSGMHNDTVNQDSVHTDHPCTTRSG